jgi:hypothetical protein
MLIIRCFSNMQAGLSKQLSDNLQILYLHLGNFNSSPPDIRLSSLTHSPGRLLDPAKVTFAPSCVPYVSRR